MTGLSKRKIDELKRSNNPKTNKWKNKEKIKNEFKRDSLSS
jgi:hypothetical protein